MITLHRYFEIWLISGLLLLLKYCGGKKIGLDPPYTKISLVNSLSTLLWRQNHWRIYQQPFTTWESCWLQFLRGTRFLSPIERALNFVVKYPVGTGWHSSKQVRTYFFNLFPALLNIFWVLNRCLKIEYIDLKKRFLEVVIFQIGCQVETNATFYSLIFYILFNSV